MRIALIASALAMTACARDAATSTPSTPCPPTRKTATRAMRSGDEDLAMPSVVLVVADGARWQDVFLGADARLAAQHGVDVKRYASPIALMPNLQRLVAASGVGIGGPECTNVVVASGPSYVSLPGYNELLSGDRAHGCFDNGCGRTALPSLFDAVIDFGGAPRDAAVFASWEPIERALLAPESMVVSTGREFVTNADILRSDPRSAARLAEGAAASSFPGDEGYRPDVLTAALALSYLEANAPRLMFIGLGDPDEYGHRDDYVRYLDALHATDRVLGDLAATLSRTGAHGRATTVLFTTDHGRAQNFRDHGGEFPESARTFVFAFGGVAPRRGITCASRGLALADIGSTIGAILWGDGAPVVFDAISRRGEPDRR